MSKTEILGLIGNPVKHSFSQTYFEKKFKDIGLTHIKYRPFELNSLKELPKLLSEESNLRGFNVTSPFKTKILHYLDYISPEASTIGAVNTVKINNGKLSGYNTDWIGFLQSLQSQTNITDLHSALIMGTGGAAKAVAYALQQCNIQYKYATTKTIFNSQDTISYSTLNKLQNFDMFDLIVNATPCGMTTYPPMADINTQNINAKHTVFDLIYNPELTMLLNLAEKQGAKIINGLQMLYNQADESWKIWNDTNE